MNNLLDSFFDYCAREGLLILPEDKKFIKDNIAYLDNISDARKILNLYRIEWQAGMSNEKNINKKENAGRRQANQFLYNFFDLVRLLKPKSLDIDLLIKKGAVVLNSETTKRECHHR